MDKAPFDGRRFASALASIPKDIDRIHHGRDLRGVDCAGLVFLAYRLAGLPIDELDVPYGPETDQEPARTQRLILRQIVHGFDRVEPNHPDYWKPGDVVLIRAAKGRDNHVGIFDGSFVWSMDRRLHRTQVRLIAPFVAAAYRHKELK